MTQITVAICTWNRAPLLRRNAQPRQRFAELRNAGAGLVEQVGEAPAERAERLLQQARLLRPLVEGGELAGELEERLAGVAHLAGQRIDGIDAEPLQDAPGLVRLLPDEAERFVAETGVDALAVAIGTSHGAYKFTKKPTGEVLAMDRIEEIHRRLPNCHLVMHGSSSVPQELQDIINKYGGKLKQTWGVPVEEIQRGIKHGVRKVNVDTEMQYAFTRAVADHVLRHYDGVLRVDGSVGDKNAFDPRAWGARAEEAMAARVAEECRRLGSAGQAGSGRSA